MRRAGTKIPAFFVSDNRAVKHYLFNTYLCTFSLTRPRAGFFMPDLLDRVRESLKRDEGLRLYLYHDTTGHQTIGYGHNVDERGITERAADVILDDDIDIAATESMMWIGGPGEWAQLDDCRKGVVIQMMFNLGMTSMRKFKQFKRALLAEDYSLAAVEMLDSRWAKQVGDRAKKLAKEMRSGCCCDEPVCLRGE